MSLYNPYPAYYDGVIEWLGSVPEHWVLGKVKNRYSIQLGKMLQPRQGEITDVEVPYLRAYNVGWESVQTDDIATMWANPKELSQFSALPGDLLVCEGGEAGRAAILPQIPALMGPLIIQNALHRVRAKSGTRERFLLYMLYVATTSGWLDVLCNKATIVHFTGDKLANLSIIYPPIDEMDLILGFLDVETARIDNLITKKTIFISLLKKKRQTIIAHAVTKGLDPMVKMRDSGVEWIGTVPTHWSVSRLGHFATVENGTTPSRDNRDFWDGGTVPWLGSGEVNQARVTNIPEFITEEALRSCPLRILPVGTVIVGMVGQGKTRGMAAILDIEATINQNLAAVCVGPRLRAEFLLHVFNAAYDWVREMGRGSNQAALNCEILGEFRLGLPPVSEQDAILETVSNETARIDLIVEKTELSITLLKERRTALITAAVTGQIDLREVCA